jgi:hypothetical protein
MATTYTLPQDLATPHIVSKLIRDAWNWKSGAAAFGLAAGFTAPICGSIVTVVSWFKDPAWHHVYLHQAGTTLFVLTLPFLILGAHCLDLLDKEKKLHASASPRRCD